MPDSPGRSATTPLIGMTMVFAAMAIVAVTAYLHAGWWSIAGYVIAAGVAVFGFVFTFRDVPNPPVPVPAALKTDDAITREK